jgi:hypothetical protein
VKSFVRPSVTALAIFLSSMVLIVVGGLPVEKSAPQMGA